MTEKQLNQLINLNKKIIKQNNKIISQNNKIISIINKEEKNNSQTDDFNGFMSIIESLKQDENKVGEVYFGCGCDIYKLKDNGEDTVVENIVGNNNTNKTTLARLIASESLKSGRALMPNTIVLGHVNEDNSIEKIENIPEVLKSCYENGMKNVLLPFLSAVDLLYAPQELLTTLNLLFYKTHREAIEIALNF